MKKSDGYAQSLPKRLLKVEEVRKLMQAEDPDYGKEYINEDWEQITERLEALARLLWELSMDHAKRDQSFNETERSDLRD